MSCENCTCKLQIKELEEKLIECKNLLEAASDQLDDSLRLDENLHEDWLALHTLQTRINNRLRELFRTKKA